MFDEVGEDDDGVTVTRPEDVSVLSEVGVLRWYWCNTCIVAREQIRKVGTNVRRKIETDLNVTEVMSVTKINYK